MLFVTIICLFLVLSSSTYAYKADCPVSIEKADKCAKVLLFEGDRDRLVPRNETEMDLHCASMTDNMKCLERHAKCYRPFPRQIFGVVLVHVKQAYKNRCVSPAGRAEFLHHMKCIKNKESSEPAHQCLDKWTVMMQVVSEKFKQEDHFPGVCCSFLMMKKCLVKAVASSCQSSTGVETAKYTDKTITEAFSDFLDLACGRQKTLDDCDRTFSDGIKILSSAVQGGVPAQNSSALFHALKIVIKHD